MPPVQRQPSDRFGDLTLSAFVDRLASSEPVPGGGSASAVAGSLAAALVAMVASLSRDRPRYAAHTALHDQAEATGHRLASRLLQIADEDAAAYAVFGAAMKLPRDTPDQLAERKAAISRAAQRAAEIPLDCVNACLDVVATAEALAGRSNQNASSDLHVASMLAEAAARGAAANVLVNLPSVDDQDFVSEAMVRVNDLVDEVARLADQTREAVLSGDAREPLPPTSPAAG
jgi:methenyltetrahydrofolate cyclohydrolase